MATKHSGKQLGAYVMPMAPEGIVFIEKPGRGRGYEFPGGHGEEGESTLEEVAARELFQETGICVEPEDMHLIEEPRELPTHTSGVFLVQIDHLPKTLRETGDDGEIIHVVKPRNLNAMRGKMFPPHRQYFDMALKLLDGKRAQKE